MVGAVSSSSGLLVLHAVRLLGFADEGRVAARYGLVRALSGVERRRATLLGVFLGAGFLLQTTGLLTASAGLSGS